MTNFCSLGLQLNILFRWGFIWDCRTWIQWGVGGQILQFRSRGGGRPCVPWWWYFTVNKRLSLTERSIDLPGSNHNTSTFPLVYFLAFYQDFINYFGWQIDLLLCPSVYKGDLRFWAVCVCVCAYVNGSVWMDMHPWLFVCHLLWRHHLPSGLKVQGPHGGKANVTGQPGQCQVPTDDVRRSPHCRCPNKQPCHWARSPPDPFASLSVAFNDGRWWSRN